MKIKFVFRRNLFYPIMLALSTLIRKINVVAISKLTEFENSILITYIMFFEEIISGLVLYIYSVKFYNYNKNSFYLKTISKEQVENISDNSFKFYF